MAKVYIFIADGFEEIEGLTVVDLLRRAGIEITMVSIMGRKEVTGSHHIKIATDLLFEDADFYHADMLILPGGMPGTNHLAEHKSLIDLLKRFNNKGGNIAAICAAPSVLGMNGILKDKKATCYPGFEEKLIDATITDKKVVVDSNIITGKGMGASIEFALCIIEKLLNKESAEKIAESIQYT